ncbi:MAG: glycosyltransferase family 4 protein [Eubacterium sp.]|nr:glycosyltransferase family 4 protein [Eubacterium sp.]
MKKLLLVRPFANVMNISTYNSQEIGLCKAFCQSGFDCDIVYFSKTNHEEIVYRDEKHRVKMIWRKGVVFGTRAIYVDFLNPFKLWKYDMIISNEYDHIMSILLALLHRNVYIYNGPYFNTFEDEQRMKAYDLISVPVCNAFVKCIFSKSDDATTFLRNKGLKKVATVGVGLDISKFSKEDKTCDQAMMNDHAGTYHILYVGTAEKRKRVGFIMRVFEVLCGEREDVRLIVVGITDKREINRLLRSIDVIHRDRVSFLGKVDNQRMADIYQKADCLVLASDKEIFGMVLLEAMYFKTPCIAKNVAGPKTVIEHQVNGILETDYNVEKWKEDIEYLLDNPDVRVGMGENAYHKVMSEFTWSKIACKMLNK